jgi:hypothetical protein
MRIAIKRNKREIECGDLVYCKKLDEYGFVGHIDENYYFIGKNDFSSLSDGHTCIEILVSNLDLELVARNKEMLIQAQSMSQIY